jgi:uncharacterized protein YlxW (UPF0749 family)
MPDAEPAVKPRRRPLRSVAAMLLRPTRGHLLVAAILLLCAFAVTIQLRARAEQQDYSTLRRTELIALLDDLTAESRRLEAEVIQLERTEAELRTGVDRQQLAQAEVDRRRTELGILAGTLPAVGDGVRVVISDPSGVVGESILLDALEELRDAGAEVIEVNDQVRVVASTWVSDANGQLTIDGTRLSRPITLDVIGDPHALTEALSFRGGLVSEITDVGGSVTITGEDEISVTAVRATTEPRFARPA